MTRSVDATTLKGWLSDGGEIALVDVREHGQYGERHPLFAVSVPYSVFESRLISLVPNSRVRLVLCDAGDGVGERAARRAATMGYTDIQLLRGGVAAWQDAGYTLYAGVNVPSKAFGELIEVERRTPHVTADELTAMIDAGEKLVIVDGRPFAEFQRMSIPGGRCCPNGELALRIDQIAPDPDTTIIVNCAGRTRSIIGAQTLIDLAIPNRVVALENGTQGWTLAGLTLDRGADRRYSATARPDAIAARRARARQLAEARGARAVDADEVADWLSDEARTTYVIDIRTDEEVAADGDARLMHAPGGQLVQATDQWIGVRGARIVLVDAEMIRAPVAAAWLRQLGHEAYMLAGGIGAAKPLELGDRAQPATRNRLPTVDPAEFKGLRADRAVQVVDLRSSMDYRRNHLRGAVWSIRPRLAALELDPRKPLVLVADEPGTAELAAIDLAEAGIGDIRLLSGDVAQWQAAALPMVATRGELSEAECIDFLFFTHRRQVDADHSRQYLAWEIALVDQLDADERAAFRIATPPNA